MIRILRDSDANNAGGSSSPAATGASDQGGEKQVGSLPATESNADDKAGETLAQLVQRTAKEASSASNDGTDTDKEKEKSAPIVGEDASEKDKKEVQDDKEPVKDDQADKSEGEDESLTDATKQPPFHEHPRWKEVVQERETLRTEMVQYKPIVEAHNAVAAYMQENGLTAEDYQEALTMAALIKNNPEEFRRQFEPIWNGVNISTGDRLPADLQKTVDALPDRLAKGEIDEIDAKVIRDQTKEIARLRANEKLGGIRQQNAQKATEGQRVKGINDSVLAWGNAQAKTDPEFLPKKDMNAPDGRFEMVAAKLTTLWAQSPPRSQQEAVALCEKAKSQILAYEARFKPAQPKTRKPLGSNGSANGSVKEPTTLAEVVQQAASRHK